MSSRGSPIPGPTALCRKCPFSPHIFVWFHVKSSALKDAVTVTELMCSWQENNGANSIEIFTAKSTGGETNRKKNHHQNLNLDRLP